MDTNEENNRSMEDSSFIDFMKKLKANDLAAEEIELLSAKTDKFDFMSALAGISNGSNLTRNMAVKTALFQIYSGNYKTIYDDPLSDICDVAATIFIIATKPDTGLHTGPGTKDTKNDPEAKMLGAMPEDVAGIFCEVFNKLMVESDLGGQPFGAVEFIMNSSAGLQKALYAFRTAITEKAQRRNALLAKSLVANIGVLEASTIVLLADQMKTAVDAYKILKQKGDSLENVMSFTDVLLDEALILFNGDALVNGGDDLVNGAGSKELKQSNFDRRNPGLKLGLLFTFIKIFIENYGKMKDSSPDMLKELKAKWNLVTTHSAAIKLSMQN